MSQESAKKYLYDYNFENEASSMQLQVGVIEGDSEDTDTDTEPAVEEKKQQKKTTSEEVVGQTLTDQDKKGDTRHDDLSSHISTKEDKRKDRRIDNLSGTKEERRRDKRDENASSYDAPAREGKREDNHRRHQKKSKVTSKVKEYSSLETAYHSKGCSDALNRHTNLPDFRISHGSVEEQVQSTSDFAIVENQGAVKHILILGTIGAGKYTIAKNISPDCQSFPSRSSLRQSGIIQRIDDGNRFRFVLVDTGGARMPDDSGAKGLTIGTIATQIKQHLRSGISLILVVVRYDCDAPEDLQVLANIISALFTDEAKQHIALIHNGCETLSKESIPKYIKNFNAGGPSRHLSSLCCKATLATAFPNLREARLEMVEYLKQTIEESKRQLSTLIESCKFLQPYSEILKANNDPSRAFPESKPDCCVM